MKDELSKDKDIEAQMGPQKTAIAWHAIAACVAYSFCSVSMVLANKALAVYFGTSGMGTTPDVFMVLLQNVVAVVMVEGLKKAGKVSYPDFNKETAMKWLPVNVFFVLMLVTGFLSLKYVHVPMVTIFKNLTNILIVAGDWYFYKESVTMLIASSFLIMLLGAVLAAINDIEFSAVGYFWMSMNCICTAAYVLYMRLATQTIRLSKFGMVFYNNLLSVGLLLPIILVKGELAVVANWDLWTSSFIFLNLFAGAVGFLLNLASLWCVEKTSATTYAIVGSLNKIPVALLGWVLFQTQITTEASLFISMSMCGGFLYSYGKIVQAPKK